MIFFKLIFWYCIVTNNTFFIDKLCNFDLIYNLVKMELQESGYYDQESYPSKNTIISCAKNAFYSIRGLELPHYSYVYLYDIRSGNSTPYYQAMMFIDKFSVTVENKIIYSCHGYEKEYWEDIREHMRISRFVCDKLDDVSRSTFPIWKKRIYLAQAKDMLQQNDYDNLANFEPIPLHAFMKID